MIVCHCNRIDHREIEDAANALARVDPWRVLTPVAVYKALGRRPQCGGCLQLAANIIHTRAGDLSCCKRCPLNEFAVGSESDAASSGDLALAALQPGE